MTRSVSERNGQSAPVSRRISPASTGSSVEIVTIFV